MRTEKYQEVSVHKKSFMNENLLQKPQKNWRSH